MRFGIFVAFAVFILKAYNNRLFEFYQGSYVFGKNEFVSSKGVCEILNKN